MVVAVMAVVTLVGALRVRLGVIGAVALVAGGVVGAVAGLSGADGRPADRHRGRGCESGELAGVHGGASSGQIHTRSVGLARSEFQSAIGPRTPWSRAQIAACVRSVTPICEKTLVRCALTVFSLI